MTDRTISRATARLLGTGIDADADISCNGSRITYVLTTFDKHGEPAPMRISRGRIPAVIRIDQDRPITLNRPPQLQNRLDFFDMEPKVPRASLLTLRLPMIEGDETLQINQTDARLRPMLEQCAQSIEASRQREQAQVDQRDADHKARCGDHPCPIVPPPIEVPTGASEGTSSPQSDKMFSDGPADLPEIEPLN